MPRGLFSPCGRCLVAEEEAGATADEDEGRTIPAAAATVELKIGANKEIGF
jgi:hypothetical protein